MLGGRSLCARADRCFSRTITSTYGRNSASETASDVWMSKPPTANTRAPLPCDSSASTAATATHPLRLFIGGRNVQPPASDVLYASTVFVAIVAVLFLVPPMTITRSPATAAPAQARRPCNQVINAMAMKNRTCIKKIRLDFQFGARCL